MTEATEAQTTADRGRDRQAGGHVDRRDLLRTVRNVVLVALFMGGLSFAAVPFYDWFCRVTGFDGTTQRADAGSETILDQEITVFFDANVNRDLPWAFEAEQPSQRLRIGENGLAFYTATNLSDEPVTGTASFSVSPPQVGGYFMKVECFCFVEQTLQPGESVRMPVAYFVDPALADDLESGDLSTITLSYTFFETEPTAAAATD